MLVQEAHAQDVWPVGYDQEVSPNATHDLPSRQRNLLHMLATFPELSCLTWYMDPPERDRYHHVGGSFNTAYHVWHHKYVVLDQSSRLLFRSEFHSVKAREHFIRFQDLVEFLDTYLASSQESSSSSQESSS